MEGFVGRDSVVAEVVCSHWVASLKGEWSGAGVVRPLAMTGGVGSLRSGRVDLLAEVEMRRRLRRRVVTEVVRPLRSGMGD